MRQRLLATLALIVVHAIKGNTCGPKMCPSVVLKCKYKGVVLLYEIFVPRIKVDSHCTEMRLGPVQGPNGRYSTM